MSGRVSPEAQALLDEGVLCYLAVSTASGPHLTPVVYVLDAGRLWVTTSRASVKARAWRRDPTVAGLVSGKGLALMFRGRVRTYDALDPLSWPATAMAGPRLLRAATRFSLRNARFFAGYAVDAGKVPLAWTPPGRIFAGIELAAARLVEADTGSVRSGWGDWPESTHVRSSFAEPSRERPLDLRTPAAVRRAVARSGGAALALQSLKGGLTVIPASWRRVASEGAYDAIFPFGLLALADAPSETPAALTINFTSSWRAAEMHGLLLQGTAALFARAGTKRGRRALMLRAGESDALALVRPRRIVWWRGWTSGTVSSRSRTGAR